jgi:phosphatidyl-myo-inositol alpha-mannosyltransferase
VRITLVCPYAWDDPGGVQVHVRELTEHLLAGGHEAQVLTPARRRERVEASAPYVRVVGRPIDVRYNASNAPIDPRPWAWRAVAAELRRFSPRVVHVHEPAAPSTAMWATLAARAPVVATFHSAAERSRLFDAAAPILRRAMRRISIRVAVSEAAAAFASRRLGGRYEIVPNGTDVSRWAGASPAELGPGRKLLFVGRLDARKGFPVALEAFARLATDRADLELIVVGDGPQRRAVDSIDPEVRARVRMMGAAPHGTLPTYHAACDVYLGPALGGESFGMVLVEAMAAGIPLVASAIDGYRDIVRDGVDGLLVPPHDPSALAAGAARILDDPELADRLRAGGRDHARSFDWTAVAPKLEALYERAVGGAASLR